jgi:hypothetical protein
MTNVPLFPRPVSWLSAVLLCVFLYDLERAIKERAKRGEV